MPYIAQKDRELFDETITALAQQIRQASKQYGYDGAFAGLLNYCCTRLALQVLPVKRYWSIALLSGVFRNIGDEFYRRFAVPYEDAQIIKSGDVPEYGA